MSLIINSYRYVAQGSMKDVESSCCFDLDATKSASYGGSGQTWANLVASPADGSAQTDYDFYLGMTSSATTDDPTFNGSAGSASAYFSLDGGDCFGLKSGTNTTFLNSLHKTTGGADFWIAMAFKYIDGSADFFGTNNGANVGIRGRLNATSDDVRLRQHNGTSAAEVDGSGTLTSGNNSVIIVSHSHSGNNTRFWVNSSTKENVAHTFQTTTASANNVMTLCAEGGGGGSFLPNGTFIYGISMGNSYIDDANAAAIIAEYETRHARDYTP